MKKMMMLMLAAALTVPTAACSPSTNAEGTIEAEITASDAPLEDNLEHSGEIAQMPNPWTEYETLAQACEESGFDMTAPEEIAGYEEKYISAIKGEIIQVGFIHSEEEKQEGEIDPCITLRKGLGDADISGDYNSYAVTTQKEIAGNTVTLKGDDGAIGTAIWTDGAYSYAITSNPALDADTMTALIEGLQ